MHSGSLPGFREVEQVRIQQPRSWDLLEFAKYNFAAQLPNPSHFRVISLFPLPCCTTAKYLLSPWHPLYPPSVRQPAAYLTLFSLHGGLLGMLPSLHELRVHKGDESMDNCTLALRCTNSIPLTSSHMTKVSYMVTTLLNSSPGCLLSSTSSQYSLSPFPRTEF